ncbi:MAG TPA: peptide-methionine (R)-S-oxide reductase MsrB [Sphingomonas sp.]|jgi:peptide-methionine (R)-S-oxide reductase|uniref:peptide-methionine (R)-S-oxide reductase MsrB n=1 Tax=Sphingomonas sp. TaxID=28214 RepID=UPI002ED87CF5
MDATRRGFLGVAGLGLGGAIGLFGLNGFGTAAPRGDFPFKLSDAQWRQRLTPAAYRVLRQEGTETPFTSPLNDEHRAGTFQCAGCALPLFSSRTKFDSGTGWPSFWQPLKGAVGTTTDRTLGMSRTEVHCARCGGHQGHVFEDGPKPTGLRYCMNGVAMKFVAGRA